MLAKRKEERAVRLSLEREVDAWCAQAKLAA